MNVKRFFIPGSEWLYFKIYTGYKSADNILVDYLLPFMMELKESHMIDNCFFIRYADPKFHIRFRIHVNNVFNYGTIYRNFEQMFTPCIDNGLVWNIQCDTYKRELERYGEMYMNEIERIFCIDSESIIRIIQQMRESATPDEDRWKLSLLLLDEMLSVFGFDLKEKQLFFKQMSDAFKKEFGLISSVYTKQLNDKFRTNRKIINDIMVSRDINIEKYKGILSSRKNDIAVVATAIDYNFDSKSDLMKSLVHMTMNRVFRSKNRLCELVIYEFLNRYYESTIARLRYS